MKTEDPRQVEAIRQLNIGLQDAAGKNHVHLARLILDSEVCPELDLPLAAEAAAKAGAVDIIELLFERGLDVDLLPRLATKNKDMLAVQRFLGMFETHKVAIAPSTAWSMFKCLLQSQYGWDHSPVATRLLNELNASTARSKDLSGALLGALYQIQNNRTGWHDVVATLISRGAVLEKTCLDVCVNCRLDIKLFDRVCAGIVASGAGDAKNDSVMQIFSSIFATSFGRMNGATEYIHTLMRHFDFDEETRGAIRDRAKNIDAALLAFADSVMREFDLQTVSAAPSPASRQRL